MVSSEALRLGLVYAFQDGPGGGAFGHRRIYQAALEQFRLADRLGYDWLNVTEHHVSEDGYLPGVLVVLAAAAGVTSTIRLSTGMLILPLHHPVRIAEEVAVIDNLSGGRVTLGVAAGYRAVEFETFGIPLEGRGARMDESLEVLRLAWSGERFAFSGDHVAVPEVVVAPVPVQLPHPPIWIGGVSPPALRRGLRFASPLCPGGAESYNDVVADIARWRSLREGADAAPDAGIVLPRLAFVADTVDEARRIALPAVRQTLGMWRDMGTPMDFDPATGDWSSFDEWVIVGDSAHCAAQMARYAEIGVSDLMLHIAMPHIEPAAVSEAITAFAELRSTLPRPAAVH